MSPRFSPQQKTEHPVKAHWTYSLETDGIHLSKQPPSGSAETDSGLIEGYITQLIDEGLVDELQQPLVLQWTQFYSAVLSGAYEGLVQTLQLPAFAENRRPVLRSSGTLTDAQFEIALAGWIGTSGRPSIPRMTGPIMEFVDSTELMTAAQWSLVSSVREFAQRPTTDRNGQHHRAAWASIRREGIAAGAGLDDFLKRSVVLAPDRLTIDWRRSDEVDGVIEVEPGFSGAPSDWLRRFDSLPTVPERYDIPTADGIVQVIVTPKVRTVLEEIKRFPARRIAGARAQAFLANPYAALGEDAKDVVDETQFEAAKSSAGIQYERFSPAIEVGESGAPSRIGLLIETASANGLTSSQQEWLSDAELSDFLVRADKSITSEYQFIAWNGYELEIQGDSEDHLRTLRAALASRRTAEVFVRYEDVYDLTNYSGRIEGIGTEKPQYSPYIAKKKDGDGWFPDNIQALIAVNDEHGGVSQMVEADDDMLNGMEDAVRNAKASAQTEIRMPEIPNPIPLEQAKEILTTFDSVRTEARAGAFDPTARPTRIRRSKSLLLKGNIIAVDYEEARTAALNAQLAVAALPRNLRAAVNLLPHQLEGLAWLQHLYRLRHTQEVRGAVLADDMGLGKTLQLLTFMARILEDDPKTLPMLVVAPVALLENWQEETVKFFEPGTLALLVAHGSRLNELRIPKEQVDVRLRTEDGLEKFLKPNWVGAARIVLTTYETLRDFEFGFARQRWSVMVCDEAQRIKNPAAMVTRAAKKQHVQFKIACTGTPVENALADLWCLFDFIQPGLLGALNEFGKTYSKPIEAKTAEQQARVGELRQRIEPQILRRTKAEVAKDLPAKRIDEACRSLTLSPHQRSLYAKAIDDFRDRKRIGAVVPFKNHLGLLHYLRSVCTDPQRYGQTVFKPEPIDAYKQKAPKLSWLLRQLGEIRQRAEKVIVFCEFREIQRLLQHYIHEELGVRADIINGDTTASAESDLSRQKRIKSFQAKPGFGVIILSPLAVGFGVNIQAANHVIHYTRTWNPAKEDQATDRAYRIGQMKDVVVYYPTVTAPDFTTFDSNLDALLSRKRELAADMLNGAGDITFEDFAIDDMAPTSAAGTLNERIGIGTVHRLSPRHFEHFVAVLWRKMGYQCHVTPQNGDHGVDVIAIRNSEGILLQAKSSGTDGYRLNWDAVKEVTAGAAFYRKQFPGVVFRTACVTNRHFNAGTVQQAELNSVELIDQEGLAQLLEKFVVMETDIEAVTFAL